MRELISKNEALKAIRNSYVDEKLGEDKKAVGINIGLTKAHNAICDMSPDEGDEWRVAVYDATKKLFTDSDIAWMVYQKIMQEMEE